MDYRTRYTPAPQAQVNEGRLFGYYTNEGWIVMRALLTEKFPYIYSRIPSCAGGCAVGPFTGSKLPDELKNVTPYPICYHEQKDEIWQLFMGPDWPLTDVWVDYPSGHRASMLSGDIGKPGLTLTSEDVWGWKFSAYESFFGKETKASEVFLPQKLHFDMGFFNRASQTKTIQMRILYNKIKYEALDPLDPKDQPIIADFLKCRIERDMPRWSSDVEGFQYKPGVKDTFGVWPVKMYARKITVNQKGTETTIIGGD